MRLRLPNATVAIDADGALPPSLADGLADLTEPTLHQGIDAAAAPVRLLSTEHGWTMEVPPTGNPHLSATLTSTAESDLLDFFVGRLNRIAFDSDPGRLHLHAAAVELDGVGVLLAGASGSGKSTVTTELLRRGASYLTDECLTILPGSATAYGYPKPITLKEGSVRSLRSSGLTELDSIEAALTGRSHLRASRLSSIVPYSRVGIIVSLRFDPSVPPVFAPISAAEAGARLLADSLDGVRIGVSAVEVIGSTLARSEAWEIVYSDARTAADLISEIRPRLRPLHAIPHWVERPRPPTAATSRIGDDAGIGTAPQVEDRSVRVVRFDDGALLHDGLTRSLVVLAPEQVTRIEDLTPDAEGETLLDLAPALGGPVVVASFRHDSLAFGLPGRPLTTPPGARPIDAAMVDAATEGRCTGVLVDQIVRGRAADAATTTDAAHRRHLAGQSTCFLLERELPALVDLLVGAGVAPVLLKGPVSAHDGPAPSFLRDFGDLDLLIPPSQIDAAVTALIDAGSERVFPSVSPDFDRRFSKSVTLQRRFTGDWARQPPPMHELDLHRTLAPGPFGELIPLDELHAWAVPVRIHDRWYRSLHPDHRFLHACLHVALGSPVPRLHSLRELIAAAPRTPAGAEAAVTAAKQWGIAVVVRRAVSLADTTYPGSVTPELRAALAAAGGRRLDHLLLASYHHERHLYSLPAVATLPVLRSWRDRRDFIAAHLRSRSARDEA